MVFLKKTNSDAILQLHDFIDVFLQGRDTIGSRPPGRCSSADSQYPPGNDPEAGE